MRYLLTISFLIINLTLVVNLWLHIKRWKEKKEVNHFKSAAFRGIGFIAAGVCLWFIGWKFSITGTLFHAFYFWLLFDGLYNLLRGYPFFQIGTIEKDEAKADNFLRTITPTQHKLLKIGLVVISLTLYILTIC